MTLRLLVPESSAVAARAVESRLAGSAVIVEPMGVGAWNGRGTETLFEPILGGSADAALLPGRLARTLPEGLAVLAVLPREEPRDLLVLAAGRPTPLRLLDAGSKVGVSGARRRAFLRAHRPDVDVIILENGATPSQALGRGMVDAVVLGALEARQSGIAADAAEILDPKAWLPAPGQGTTVVVGRPSEDPAWTAVDDETSRRALQTELALIAALGVPWGSSLGALAQPTGQAIRLWAAAASNDGRDLVRSDRTGPRDDPQGLARVVAQELTERGLARVLSGASP